MGAGGARRGPTVGWGFGRAPPPPPPLPRRCRLPLPLPCCVGTLSPLPRCFHAHTKWRFVLPHLPRVYLRPPVCACFCVVCVQSMDMVQLCGSVLVNATKVRTHDAFKRMIGAGLISRLVVYCRMSSREHGPLQSCVAALSNLAEVFDLSDVVLLEGACPHPLVIVQP